MSNTIVVIALLLFFISIINLIVNKMNEPLIELAKTVVEYWDKKQNTIEEEGREKISKLLDKIIENM